MRDTFFQLTLELDKKRIAAHAGKMTGDVAGVVLDETWRTKIRSHLARVRDIVEGADLDPPIRDTIINRLNDLDREIDRKRTRVQKFSDAFVGICEGISGGAEALKPAARLVERIIGSLARLKRQEGETKLELPRPETLGLPDYTNGSDGEQTAEDRAAEAPASAGGK